MALFGSARDASLVRSINRELVYDFIDTEIAFYKLSLDDTKANMYDESDNKVYYAPMRFNCLVQKDEKTYIGDDSGYDSTRTGIFSFHRPELKSNNVVIEEGDIIEWDNEFYEIDGVGASQYWRGINPTTDLGNTLSTGGKNITGDDESRDEFGQSIAVICQAHVTRRNRLNIQEVRSGVNKTNSIPRNL
tara:strand:- start:440 stop:1009 length:570 start_codon:yes stop_codon:yes gene_type:complete